MWDMSLLQLTSTCMMSASFLRPQFTAREDQFVPSPRTILHIASEYNGGFSKLNLSQIELIELIELI